MRRSTFFRFAGPSLFIMTLLMLIPLLMAIYLGMNYVTYNNVTEPQFVGLRNYLEVLQDSRFWQSFLFTAVYMVFVVPATMIVGFSVALLLDQVSTFTRGIYLSLFLLPFIIVPIVGTLMFKQLFEPSGLLTYVYQTVLGTKFRYTETSVKVLILFYGLWYVAPFALVTYFAGLQTLISRSRPQNRTIFSVIEDEKTESALALLQEVCGDLTAPATGIAFTLPLDRVVGLAPELGEDQDGV